MGDSTIVVNGVQRQTIALLSVLETLLPLMRGDQEKVIRMVVAYYNLELD